MARRLCVAGGDRDHRVTDCGVDVAHADVERTERGVAGRLRRLRVGLLRVLPRLLFDLDPDSARRFLGGLERVGQDHRHRLPVVENTFALQRQMVRRERGNGLFGEPLRRTRKVAGDQDALDPGHCHGLARVGRCDDA